MNSALWLNKRNNDKKSILEAVYWACIVLIMVLMFITISLELCEEWQVPKDRRFLSGIILSLVLVFFIRRIHFKKIEVWITVACEALFIFLWFRIKEINTGTYGVVYFWVYLYTWIAWALFIALMVDLVRSFKTIVVTKALVLKILVYVLLVGVLVFTDKNFWIPTVCPILAFTTTKFTKEKWSKFLDCIAISYYIAFIYLMTKSYITAPDIYENGRYMGMFLSVENIGAFCGLAFICALYFIVRVFYSEEKKWQMFIVPGLMLLYPTYSLLVINSRTTQVAVIITLLVAFVFMHGSEKKGATIKRLFIAVIIIAVIIIGLLGLAKHFNSEIKSGRKYSGSQAYVIAHIVRLVDEEYNGKYFEPGTAISALDGFMSGRLRCWAEAVKQIEFRGHPYEMRPPLMFVSPHNFFIQKMIEMGWIKGIYFNLFLVATLVVGLVRCVKRDIGAVLPTLMFIYVFFVLACTILSWYSLPSFVMLLFSCMLLFGKGKTEE